MSYNDTRGPRRFENGNRGDYRNPDRPQRPKLEEEVIGTRTIEGPRKTITISHRRNRNGDFLRIDEARPGQTKGSIVIIPGDQIEAVLDAMEDLFPVPEEAGQAKA